jgi:hypothetical protein
VSRLLPAVSSEPDVTAAVRALERKFFPNPDYQFRPGQASRLWINHVLDRRMRSRVRSTRKKPEVFKWKKCMEDFVHGQLEVSCERGFLQNRNSHRRHARRGG